MYNYNMNGLFVTPITQRKRAELERVFGTDQIPVTSACPAPSPSGCLAYTLDTARLHWMQVNRLTQWLTRRDGLTPGHARALVTAGLPIPAAEVALVQDHEQERGRWPAPAFVLSGRVIQPGLFLC